LEHYADEEYEQNMKYSFHFLRLSFHRSLHLLFDERTGDRVPRALGKNFDQRACRGGVHRRIERTIGGRIRLCRGGGWPQFHSDLELRFVLGAPCSAHNVGERGGPLLLVPNLQNLIHKIKLHQSSPPVTCGPFKSSFELVFTRISAIYFVPVLTFQLTNIYHTRYPEPQTWPRPRTARYRDDPLKWSFPKNDSLPKRTSPTLPDSKIERFGPKW